MSTSIDLKRLQHLVLLAEELNFSRAAERAFLSQTAFSRSIQVLEAEFGMRLFDRGTRSVQITSTGQHLVARARDLLARVRDMAYEVDYLANADGGVLSFGASLFAVDTALSGVLSQFTRTRPAMRVNVEVSQWEILLKHLEDESIEFFIGYASTLDQDPRFTVTPLQSRPASLYCRSGHPMLVSMPAGPYRDQVARYPWAMVQMDKVIAGQLRSLFAVPADHELPLALRCDNQVLLREMLLCSDTILFTWEAWLKPELRDGTVVDVGALLQPAIPAQARQLSLGIVHLAGRTLSPAARKLIDAVRERDSRAG